MAYMEQATEEQIREFYAEFDATEETIKRDVQYLIEWLRKQPHLPSIEDEEWLANFLLRGKNDLEKTKMLIENYYTARAKMPEIFRNRGTKYFDRIKTVRELIIICPLPKLTPEGYRLIVFRGRFADGNIPDPIDTLKFAQMILDLNLKTDKVRGLTLIYDYENTGLAFVKAFFPVIRRALMIQSKINPVRYNRLYHLNLPPYAQPILSFTASFLKKQMEKMIVWNKTLSELADEISPDCLPKEYGGKLGTVIEEEGEIFCMFYNPGELANDDLFLRTKREMVQKCWKNILPHFNSTSNGSIRKKISKQICRKNLSIYRRMRPCKVQMAPSENYVLINL